VGTFSGGTPEAELGEVLEKAEREHVDVATNSSQSPGAAAIRARASALTLVSKHGTWPSRR
jgi:hypothetical protein